MGLFLMNVIFHHVFFCNLGWGYCSNCWDSPWGPTAPPPPLGHSWSSKCMNVFAPYPHTCCCSTTWMMGWSFTTRQFLLICSVHIFNLSTHNIGLSPWKSLMLRDVYLLEHFHHQSETLTHFSVLEPHTRHILCAVAGHVRTG